jgi:arylsulfatase A-like enzyme
MKSALALGSGVFSSCDHSTTDFEENNKRPNILLLLADDQSSNTLGCTGHPFVQTPNIDKLAAEGCLFENTFVTSPICAASRASIFTGLHERTHQYTFRKEPLEAKHSLMSYPSLLKKGNYTTGFIGKFGVRSDLNIIESSFDYFKAIPRKPYFHTLQNGQIVHETKAAAFYAKDFISKAEREDKPFCLSVSFNAPHAADSQKVERPFPPTSETEGMYDNFEVPQPKMSERQSFKNLPGFLKTSLNRIRYFWRWGTTKEYEQNMRDYLSMITGIDMAIGDILNHLESLNLRENTVVIYSADNGFYMGERGFAGKWSHFDEALQVPLIISDPRVGIELQGIKSSNMVLNIDICPTILDYANIESRQDCSGRSLKPLLQGNSRDKWRSDFLCEHLMNDKDIPKWEGIREDSFSYFRYFEQSPQFEFLYDMRSDSKQLNNLGTDPKYSFELNRLRARCDELIRNKSYKKTEHDITNVGPHQCTLG